ncbi:MAG: MarR family transcriptional regulator [Acidobacteria bacterium]|nr:MarR family transcriptional regulator [Acidobacteriota bacterium]
MKPPSEQLALRKVVDRLGDLLTLPPSDMTLRNPPSAEVDAVANLGDLTFAIEWKGSSSLPQVSRAAEQVRQYALGLGPGVLPLVAFPFLGPVGREHCREAGVNWLDLSGNASITAPGVRVLVQGQPNLFKQPGRPASAFAPKSSRIARWLLLHPGRSLTQRELARATGMDEGFTSRIVSRLEHDELVIREPDGAIRAGDPDLLLDAWREDYDFSKHQIVKGHVAARSGQALLGQLSERLHDLSVGHAATGLAAAWLLSRFAGFRTVATYVREIPSPEVLGKLGFREDVPGANLWLVAPNDEGVFHGAGDHDGIPCVHPVQAYLDLKEQPERSAEAAAQLRAELLNWSTDA